jgi:hypothetical protein
MEKQKKIITWNIPIAYCFSFVSVCTLPTAKKSAPLLITEGCDNGKRYHWKRIVNETRAHNTGLGITREVTLLGSQNCERKWCH